MLAYQCVTTPQRAAASVRSDGVACVGALCRVMLAATAAPPDIERDLRREVQTWVARHVGYRVTFTYDADDGCHCATIRMGDGRLCVEGESTESARGAWHDALAEFASAAARRSELALAAWNRANPEYAAAWASAPAPGRAEVVVRRAATLAPVVFLSAVTAIEVIGMLSLLCFGRDCGTAK